MRFGVISDTHGYLNRKVQGYFTGLDGILHAGDIGCDEVLQGLGELAVVHARENIRVNALCPGPLRTELLMKFLDTEAKKERRLVHIPMGRFGDQREIAYAALYLASDESSFVTGTAFMVDGGLSAAYVTPE